MPTATEEKRYRCDTPVEVTIKSGSKVLSKEEMTLDTVNAHVTVQSYMRGGAFGQNDWRDNKGRPTMRPKYTIKVLDESYELTGNDLCTCPKHAEN